MKKVLVSLAAAALLCTTPMMAKSSAQVSKEAVKQAKSAAANQQVKVVQEAVQAVALTQKVLIDLNKKDTKAAKADLEKAIGKLEVVLAMRQAINKAGCPCHALTDGVTVPITDNLSYIPDALVYCGEKLDGKSLAVPNPVILVEVLSPSTAWNDVSTKLTDYFTLDSVLHYLILDPARSSIMHHYRDGHIIRARTVNTDTLVLDPPRITLDIKSIFPD